MKIGIMGLGFVGNATKQVLETKHEVFGYDPVKEGYKDPFVLKKTEVIFICVGTPMSEDYSVDLKYIEQALQMISDMKIKAIVCIKSTIPPGTIDDMTKKYNLKIGCNPEFLREKFAVKDFLECDRIIIGGSDEVIKKIRDVYLPIFSGDKIIYAYLDAREGEMIKHATNAFLASQVAFANEMYLICQKLGVSYDVIKDTLFLDKRLGRHIDVPGPDGKFGFGGHCLPKDLNGLISHSIKKGYKPYLLEEIWRFNQTIR